MGKLTWFKKGRQYTSDVNSMNNNFDYKQPTSNSDMFQFFKNLEAANMATLAKTGNYFNLSETEREQNDALSDYLDQRNLNEWWLLQLQANYYVNTIRFRCSDYYLRDKIKQVIWGAFIYGKAGLYYDVATNTARVVLINSIETNDYCDPIKAKVSYLKTFDSEIKLDDDFDEVLTGENLSHLHIFKWGVNSQSALVFQYPFIRVQKEITDQLTLSSLLLGKKVLEKVDAESKNSIEIKDWLNPKKFWMRIKRGVSVNEKIEIMEKDVTNNVKEIQFYKEFENRWYSLFGRKVNNDFKKERQITDEIGLLMENYDTLEKTWTDQFEIFIASLKADVSINVGDLQCY